MERPKSGPLPFFFSSFLYVSNTWGYWVSLLPYFNDLDANEAAESSISKVYSSSKKESRLAFVTNNADSWWGCFKRAAWNIDEPFVLWKFSIGENLFVYRSLIRKKKKKKMLSRVLRRPNKINKVTSILSPENYFARHFSSLCFLLSSYLIFISFRAIFCLQSNCHGSLKKHPHPTVSIAEFPLKKKKKQGKSNKQATRSRVINFRWSSRASR